MLFFIKVYPANKFRRRQPFPYLKLYWIQGFWGWGSFGFGVWVARIRKIEKKRVE